MDGRRDLSFERIEDVMPEVERLLSGHSTIKGWTLGQILNHLATGIHLCLEADPSALEPVLDPEAARVFKVRRRLFFRGARFPEGLEIPIPALRPPESSDERDEAESLRVGFGRLVASSGPFRPHPVLGPLTRDEWLDFHRMHCAHHLSFAKVDSPEGDSR